MRVCPKCESRMDRSRRTRVERWRYSVAYTCPQCAYRHLERKVRFCWRCGGDLDRRKRNRFVNRLLGLLGLNTYSCRRCATRRYRFL